MTTTHADLNKARAALDIDGGWLLDLGGSYLVTQSEGMVRDLRNHLPDYMSKIEAAGFDETKMGGSN